MSVVNKVSSPKVLDSRFIRLRTFDAHLRSPGIYATYEVRTSKGSEMEPAHKASSLLVKSCLPELRDVLGGSTTRA